MRGQRPLDRLRVCRKQARIKTNQGKKKLKIQFLQLPKALSEQRGTSGKCSYSWVCRQPGTEDVGGSSCVPVPRRVTQGAGGALGIEPAHTQSKQPGQHVPRAHAPAVSARQGNRRPASAVTAPAQPKDTAVTGSSARSRATAALQPLRYNPAVNALKTPNNKLRFLSMTLRSTAKSTTNTTEKETEDSDPRRIYKQNIFLMVPLI